MGASVVVGATVVVGAGVVVGATVVVGAGVVVGATVVTTKHRQTESHIMGMDSLSDEHPPKGTGVIAICGEFTFSCCDFAAHS